MLGISEFLTSLPRLKIRQLPNEIRIPLMPSVKPLIPYNGFDGYQRTRTWEVAKWLMAHGAMPKPKYCNLCQASADQYHAENYFDFSTYIPVCRSCHGKVHNRLRNFDTWATRLKSFKLPALHWANALGANPLEIAQWCDANNQLEPTFTDFVA